MTPADKRDNEFYDLRLEIAIVKKDIESLQINVGEIKEEIGEIKGWATKAFWIVAGAIILQLTTFVLNGGLHAIIK